MSSLYKKKILLVFIEPTPYILGIIKALESSLEKKLDILFLEENRSQDWNLSMSSRYLILPKKHHQKISLILNIFFKKKYHLIHLAGWSEPICLLFIFLSKCFNVMTVVESDTPYHQVKRWKQMLKRICYPFIFRFINTFLTGGRRQKKYLEYYGVNPKFIFSMQMTVDVSFIQNKIKTFSVSERLFIRESFRIPKENIVFIFVGRLEFHKGICDLIEAFKLLPPMSANLLFVGDGIARAYVEESARLNANIHYAGRLVEIELIKAYHAADVLVLPSHFEPWGLVVNEAMAAGLPVIVSDKVGCIDDLVHHQQTGLIFKAGCVDSLYHALNYAISERYQLSKMSKNSMKLIDGWTLENEAQKICYAWGKTLTTLYKNHLS